MLHRRRRTRAARGSPSSPPRRRRRRRRSGRPRRSPARCAWRERLLVARSRCASSRERMKFVVPLTMPWMRSMCAPASDSRSTRITGHDARDRRLEAEVHAALARQRPQLLAVAREQLLVGGDDVAPGLERAAARSRSAASTPPISSTIELRALEDLVEVAARARQHADDLGRATGQPLDLARALAEQPLERRADGAVPEQADRRASWRRGRRMRRPGIGACADPRRVHAPAGHTSRACRSSSVSRRTTTRASPSLQKITGRPRHAVVVVGHRVAVGAGRRRRRRRRRARGSSSSASRISTSPDSQCLPASVHARRAAEAIGDRRPGSARRRASAAGCRTCRRRR